MTNCGSNWKHQDRMSKNTCDKGEQVCPMVLLIKDHKGWRPEMDCPPPSRPVVSGKCGLNSLKISELNTRLADPKHKCLAGNDDNRNSFTSNDDNHSSFASNDEAKTGNTTNCSTGQAGAEQGLKLKPQTQKRPKYNIRSYGLEG